MKAGFFDFDGVLVNSEPLHYRALRDCLLPEAIVVDQDDYARNYLAYDDREAIRIALEHHGQPYDSERVAILATRKAKMFEGLMKSIPFFPGAHQLVRTLGREVPLAVVSGALHLEIERVLTSGGLREAFAAVVGADDVSQGKPHPEPYLAAMARLSRATQGLEPGECVAFEDSAPGIASALAAGMKVVAVTNSYPAEKLKAAHLVVASLEDLKTHELHALFP